MSDAEGARRNTARLVSLLANRRDEMLVRFGVKKLGVCMSTSRDGMRNDSDVGIVIEFQDAATFQRYLNLKGYLDALLGTPISRWVMLGSLKTRWLIVARGLPDAERTRP